MSAWKLAMVLALPLMWGGAKPRTWLAMFAGSVAAIYVPFASAYVFIDIASGAAVLKRPACMAQKAIGLFFAAMVMFDVGYLFSSRSNPELFAQTMSWLGWVQFAILLAWGGYDAFGNRFRMLWADWFFRPAALGGVR